MITNHLESIKKVFIDYPRLYEVKQEELKGVSGEEQDLLHALEFGKLDAIKMTQIVRDLKAVRIEQRKLKNNLEVLIEIRRFVNRFERQKIKTRDINDLINRIEHITTRKRTYTMRVREDLQELVDNA